MIASKIEEQINVFYSEYGFNPNSLEFTVEQKTALERELTETTTMMSHQYKPEGEEFGEFDGIKCYVKKERKLKIEL